VLRSKWKKWVRRPPLPKAEAPRQVIQCDTVDLGELFSINFIDIFTKEEVSIIVTDQTSETAAAAAEKAFSFFDGTVWLQNDNGKEFQAKFRKTIRKYCQHHRYITPYQKEENGYIESFNRTFRKECVGWRKYKVKDKDNLQKYVNKWLDEYHTERPHLSLNLQTPKEFVDSWAERRLQT
jgi:transposase InsO family protein